MNCVSEYISPLGEIILTCDEAGLNGLRFRGQKYCPEAISESHTAKEHRHILDAKRWLDIYFSGRCPDFTPTLHTEATPFRALVWEELLAVPFGTTTTYARIAANAAARLGRERMSAQAVGGAVGHNPISIIIPCHRVIGSNGSLIGYAGGLERKLELLKLEKTDPAVSKRKTF